MNKIQLLNTAILLLLTSLTYSQTDVHLIQGLGESQDVWDGLKQSINTNCNKTTAFSYSFNTTNGISNAESSVSGNITSGVKNIGIGHFMGGVVLNG